MKRKSLIFFSTLLIYFMSAALHAAADETGTASWYGGKFQGRQTANGEIFDTRKLTAAHRTLPFGTMVKVIHQVNGKSVTVRINDRGPFVQGRIIDLSQAAAETLDMIHTGTAPVKIIVLSGTGESAPGGQESATPATGTAAGSPSAQVQSGHIIQVGSFSVRENAKSLLEYLTVKGFGAALEQTPAGVTRVIVPDIAEADLQPTLNQLKKAGLYDFLVRKQ